MGQLAGVFAKLREATPSQRTPFFLPGSYRVEVKEVSVVTSPKDGSLYFIVHTKIINSTNPERKPGSICGQIIKITGNVSAMGNIKAFLAGALGMDPNNTSEMQAIDGDMVEKLLASKELAGTILDLTATQVKTSKGHDFTQHSWALAQQE